MPTMEAKSKSFGEMKAALRALIQIDKGHIQAHLMKQSVLRVARPQEEVSSSVAR